MSPETFPSYNLKAKLVLDTNSVKPLFWLLVGLIFYNDLVLDVCLILQQSLVLDPRLWLDPPLPCDPQLRLILYCSWILESHLILYCDLILSLGLQLDPRLWLHSLL